MIPCDSNTGDLLIVAGDLSIRQALESQLIQIGYRVRCASDGQAALLVAHEERPELILVDILLPDSDGYDICRRLKEDPKAWDMAVLLMNTADTRIDKLKGYSAGANDFITQIIEFSDVRTCIETNLFRLRRLKGLSIQKEKDETVPLGKVPSRNPVSPFKFKDEQRQYEMLLIDISTRFINLPVDQIDDAIIDAQRRICECFELDLSSLWQWSPRNPRFITLTHPYRPYGGQPIQLPMDTEKFFPWCQEQLMAGKIVPIPSMDKLPPEADIDRQTFLYLKVKSAITFPLVMESEPIFGILSFDTIFVEHSWPDTIVNLLFLVSQIFTHALARKRYDYRLRLNRDRLNLAIKAAGAGLWSLDVDTGNVLASPEIRKLFGFGDGDLNYESFLNVIHPEDRERVNEVVQSASHSGDRFQCDYRVILPAGVIRWIGVSGQRYLDSGGEAQSLMGVSLDITERKITENQLKEQLREIADLKQRLEKENIFLQHEVAQLFPHSRIVGQSQVMKKVLAQAMQVASTDSMILILGETGTGKELLARAIHSLSLRKNRPMVTVNCASLPATLIESELFGREKGAYTGALTKMPGRFEVADGSTLFLDEIGELPLELQSKLLRVLENGVFEHLGSTTPIHVNVRIIAATNRDLDDEVKSGRFRKDLFYRLNVFPIVLPPLRERPEDIRLMVWSFVKEFQEKMGKRIESIPKRCMEALESYSWPGNVRELRNVIERAIILSTGKVLQISITSSLPPENYQAHNLLDVERSCILEVLEKTGWRISGKGGAAEVLGLKRTTLQAKMKKLGLRHPSK